MSEANVVNSFLIFRVLLVGSFLLVLPHVTRKGLLFGAYVGEGFAASATGRQLLRTWRIGCLAVMVAALLVGLSISAAGWPVPGNLTGTAVLLLAAAAHYLRLHARTRSLVPPAAVRQAAMAAAPLQGGRPKGVLFATTALGACLLVCFVTFAYAIASYEAMPDRVPALSGIQGEARGLSDKSLASVLFIPASSLLFSLVFGISGVLSSQAKLSVRGGSGGRSAEGQNAFRAAMARLSGLAAILFCALLTLLSVQLIRFQLSEIPSIGTGVVCAALILIVFMLGSQIWILRRYGQGGARIEDGSADSPLAGGIADNAHWVWGLFYVDRHDPSIAVESRFGFGYTLNYGNRTALLITGTFVVLSLSVVTLGLIAFAL